MSINIAVVGATGIVGQTLLKVLRERDFPLGEVRLLASRASAGKAVEFGDRVLEIGEATRDSFRGVDLAFFAASEDVSQALVPAVAASGTIVIDHSTAFRMTDGVPLVVPEVNAHHLNSHRGLIANPNCCAVIMSVALGPIYQHAGISRVVVSTYQAASGAGLAALEELEAQVGAHCAGRPVVAKVLPSQAARKHYPLSFNVIPQVDLFRDDGYTHEEHKIMVETQKIFADQQLRVSATAVRVPVMWCHSESISVETRQRIGAVKARELLTRAPGVVVMDDPAEQLYPMPVNVAERDEVFVGRIREDSSLSTGLQMWAVGNQLRKGAATNAVQIAEILVSR